MKLNNYFLKKLSALFAVMFFGFGFAAVNATEPCDDFGECKVLVEINSSDGDVGFHFLMDGDDLLRAAIYNPRWRSIFAYSTRRELRRQTLTETFAESAEPLCWFDPEEDPEDVVTLGDFLQRWKPGDYHFVGINDDWDLAFGESELTFKLPAAPRELEYEEEEEKDADGEVEVVGEISWEPGNDLGNCAESASEDDDPNIPNLADVLHLLDEHPEDVDVAAWDVVFEPEFSEDDPRAALSLKHTVRLENSDDIDLEVEIPSDYLETLPDNTPVKIEIGAIGFDDNATFTEIDEICVNENDENEEDLVDGCGFEIDEDEDA